MIPNPRYFPGTMQERAAWYQNLVTQLANVASTLGLTAAEITTLTNDAAVMNSLAEAAVLLDSYVKAVREFRIYITEGNVGDPNPEFPVAPTISVSGTPTGMFERLDGYVKRIRASAAYTPEIGALLGIIPQSPVRPAPSELKPTIKVGSSPDSYSFTISATRFGLNAYMVQIRRSGQETWVDSGFAQNKDYTVTVSPTTPGQPERIQVRAILIDKSLPIGEPSDPKYVTVNP